MAEYFTEAAYQRWYRQYQTQIQICEDLIKEFRIRLEPYWDTPEVKELEVKIDELEAKIEEMNPRNFNQNAKPLIEFEKFFENIKVLVNIISRMRGKGDLYLGVYQEEKEKALKIYQEYHVKDRLKHLQDRVNDIEAKYQSDANQMVGTEHVVAQ